MADAIAGAQLVVIPDAGHSPQFENPAAWIDALTGFLSVVARDRASSAPWRLTAVASRSRCCSAHGVDTMFTLSGGHLFVLYDGAVQSGDLRLSTRGTSRPRCSRPKAGRR